MKEQNKTYELTVKVTNARHRTGDIATVVAQAIKTVTGHDALVFITQLNDTSLLVYINEKDTDEG